MKRIWAAISVLGLLLPVQAQACAVCFGKDAGKSTDAINLAIFFMLGVIGSVLIGIVSVGFTLARRARRYELQKGAEIRGQINGVQNI